MACVSISLQPRDQRLRPYFLYPVRGKYICLCFYAVDGCELQYGFVESYVQFDLFYPMKFTFPQMDENGGNLASPDLEGTVRTVG